MERLGEHPWADTTTVLHVVAVHVAHQLVPLRGAPQRELVDGFLQRATGQAGHRGNTGRVREREAQGAVPAPAEPFEESRGLLGPGANAAFCCERTARGFT
ncbi:MAG: hypothetical protein ACK50C_08890, partial [Gemmatimonadaceae bacterium]